MRLRLEIRRHDLPSTKIAWNTSGLHAYTAAAKSATSGTLVSQLLQDVNALIPLESEEWGLEDYIVEHDGYECLHFSYLEQILTDGDLLIIRPLESPEVRSRRVSGRDQISVDGRHLHDGVAFGQPLTRFIQRPSIRIPPRKKARLALEPKSDELEPEQDVDVQRKAERVRKEYKGLIDERATARGLAIVGAGINTPKVKTPKGVSFSKAQTNEVVETPATVVWADEMDEDDEDDEDFAGGETSEESESSDQGKESDSDVSSSESNKENIAPSTELPPRRSKVRQLIVEDESGSETADTEVRTSTRTNGTDENMADEEDSEGDESSVLSETSSSSSSSSESESESSESSASSAAESIITPPKEVPTTSRKRKAQDDLAQQILSEKVAREKPTPKQTAAKAETQKKPKAVPVPTQLPVPPGEGMTKTQRRNQRRKLKIKVDKLKEQGLLNDNSTPEEVEAQLAIYDAQSSRTGGSITEAQAMPEPALAVDVPVNGIPSEAAAEAEETTVDGTKEDTTPAVPLATEEPQLSKRQLKRRAQKEAKAKEKAEFEKRKDDLMTSIANGGVDVTPSKPVEQAKEVEIEKAAVEIPDSQIPPAESTPASAPGRRLDLGSAQRLLFGALGLRTPKTKEDAEKLRTKLETLNPRRSVPVNTSEAPESETAQENITTELQHDTTDTINAVVVEDDDDETKLDKAAALAGGYEYDPHWRDKIVVSAVECVWENVEYPPPPFPFVQRWHGIRYSDTKRVKKRKRRNDAQYYQNEFPVEGEYVEENVELDYDGVTVGEDGLGDAVVEDDLPPVPQAVSSLPLLDLTSAKAGTVICYKVLEATAQTRWQPQVSKMLTAEVLSLDGGKLEMRLAKRDQTKREIDPITGEKIYSNFELRPDDEAEDEEQAVEDPGLVELDFAELIEPRVVKAPANLDQHSAGLVTLSTGTETTQRTGPQDSIEYQFAQVVAPLGQSESAPSLQIQQDEDVLQPNGHDESELPPSVQVQTTIEHDDVGMQDAEDDFIMPGDDDVAEITVIEEDIVPETILQAEDDSSPTPVPQTPPPAEDISIESHSHGYVSAVSAIADRDALPSEEPDTPLPAPIAHSASASLPPALHFNSMGSLDGSFDLEENGLPDLNDFISASQAHWSQAPRSRTAQSHTQSFAPEAEEEEEEDVPLPQTVPAITTSRGPPAGSQIIDITLSSDVDVPVSKSQPVPSRRTSVPRKKKKRT